jgi:dienelactone hydrolase
MKAYVLTDNDTLTPPELRQQAEETFLETGITWQSTLYSHVEHGFGVRANLTDPRQRFAQEGAYLQAVRWLRNWVKV